MKEIYITKLEPTTNVFLTLTHCIAFIPSGFPMRRAFALTEQSVTLSVTLMMIVHALNGWHPDLAAISGARFEPPFQFWRCMSHASCWLVTPPADNWWLCATAKSSQLYAISLHTHEALQSIHRVCDEDAFSALVSLTCLKQCIVMWASTRPRGCDSSFFIMLACTFNYCFKDWHKKFSHKWFKKELGMALGQRHQIMCCRCTSSTNCNNCSYMSLMFSSGCVDRQSVTGS